MKEDRIDPANASSERPESHVVERRRSADVVSFPAAAPAVSVATCELLAETALEYARAGETVRARRAVGDAVKMAEALSEAEESSDLALVARAMILAGDAFILLMEMHRAAECFELASTTADGAADVAGAAQARFGLACALRELHDPRARAVLEDAGELYEELGDETTVLAIDRLLREMESDFEETPRSFHSSSRILRASRT